MTSSHIVVIGAGIAGLTAAYRLQQAGHDVLVLESQPGVGGRMITIYWQGVRIDPGAEFVTGADRYLLELVRDLGIQDHLVDYSQDKTGFEVSVMRDGKVHTVNFMDIPAFFSWKAVSLGARLSMAKLLPHMLRYSKIDVFHPENAPGEDRLNMEEFFQHKIHPELYDYWVEPTMDVFCGYVTENLSAKMMLVYFGSYLGQKLHTFKEGIGFLPDTLASRMEVVCDALVTRITRYADRSGVKISYRHEGQEKTIDADAVVVAVGGDQFLPLCEDPEPAWQAFFSRVGYSRVGIVYHIVEGDDPVLDKGGIMFPRKEPWKIGALGWGRKSDGRVHVMSDLKAYLYNPAIRDDELKQTITEEMIRAVPAFAGKIKDQMVFRWERKVPLFPVGHLAALKTFKEFSHEGPLYFCGDYLIGSTAGSALASGWQCAERILEKTA